MRQFIEFAVNMPEHEPHVGHAFCSIAMISSSLTEESTALTIASIRSRRTEPPSSGAPDTIRSPSIRPASMGPPETNTVGMLSRSAASSMPGVILSQLLMQISASAWWALTMYSTESAMTSRLGSEYSIPEWPMAMPSSTAIELNSRPTPPASATAPATSWPMSLRWTCPGTNWVKLLAIATIGFPKSLSVIPVARHRARAPAMLRPCVVVRERS